MSLRTALGCLLALSVLAALPAVAAEPAKSAAKPKSVAKTEFKTPDTFKTTFETSKGNFVVEFHRDWAPNGVDRVYDLIRTGFFDNARFFRVVPGFVVQFGIPANPAVGAKWMRKNIQDDPPKPGISNTEGTVTFAQSGQPNSRSTQLFINLVDNSRLDAMNFEPVGKVVEGFDVVQKLNGEYGESLTQLQGEIWSQGNAFLMKKAPNLDFIKKVVIQK